MKCVLVFITVLLMIAPARADITVITSATGETHRVVTIMSEKSELADLPAMTLAFGFTWKWNSGAQQLTCEKPASRLVFTRDIACYLSSGTLLPLFAAPVRIGPTLYLPVDQLISLCARESGRTCQWDSAAKTVTIAAAAVTRAPESIIDMQAQSIKTIVIDPGHGGRDPGAIGSAGIREKDVVLEIALALQKAFSAHKGLRVLLTRDRDVFIPLAQRTRMANEWKADLFISIHANAVPGNKKKKETISGHKVYFLSQAKNEEDKLAAMRENAVIELEDRQDAYGGLQNVLNDLAGNEYLRESQELCILLDRQFESSLSSRISRQDRGIGQANFWVLNGAYMPSILIETGFISNRNEERLLAEKSFQKSMALAISMAVIRFKEKFETGL
ncbi:MAG: N-acetylmuramoyl-L-alanine amidase [Chitinispirillaceae bacterium]|jgi:N-acetylmuramoyl-L-alanine amidase|nr:N-acetylmuramoyl-L-alanine amidase [Chitinispirillaceae bacterium]